MIEEIIGSEFCQLTVTCTTNEWDKDRVKAISDFFRLQGATVKNQHLKHCDYYIDGIYRDVNINLGIEYKKLVGDFYPSLQDMPDKFIAAYHEYDEVALFVEESNYSIKITDDGLDGYVQNPAMQAVTGAEGIGTLAMFNNFMASMSNAGIHTRAFRSIAHFPITVSGLLKHLVKPTHRGLTLGKPENYKQTLMNMLVWFPGIGAKTAAKALQYIPNLTQFNSMQLSDLQDIFGQSQGSKVYTFLNDGSRIKECGIAWEQLYEKNAPKRRLEIDKLIKANKKSKGIDQTTPPQRETLKSNPDKPFYSGELSYLNDTPQEYKEVTPNKSLSLSNSNLTDTAMNSPVAHDTFSSSGAISDRSHTIASSSASLPDVSTPDNLHSEAITSDTKARTLNQAKDSRNSTAGKQSSPMSIDNTLVASDILITEIDLLPRIKDVVEYIRRKPRSLEDVMDYFEFSKDYAFRTLMEFKLAKKIWYENSSRTFQFGLDRNPAPVVAMPEMEIGV